MKIGIIIPDRQDRPEFLKNCLRMINAQTLSCHTIELINHKPGNEKCDITKRYKIGYERFKNIGIDVIALIENDDWYAPDYLEIMVNEWVKHRKPDIFGTNYTIYYHLKLKVYFTMYHYSRASAMNTLLKPDLNFDWCPDHEPYTDLHLWKVLKGVTYKPEKIISIGMKHGIGFCGGRSHVDRLNRYVNTDLNLKEIMDAESFNFYDNYFK